MHQNINEQSISDRANRGADRMMKRADFQPYFNALESKSPLAKVRPITQYDIYAVGKQLEAFEDYKHMCEEDGTLAQLGKIPDVAFDVITVAYGSSPMSVMASTQPIEEERGSVYFKELVAQTTRGNVTAGDALFKADQASPVAPMGFAGDEVTEILQATVSGTQTYSGNVTSTPIRTQKVVITIGGLNLSCRDDGNGFLIGYNLQGTIDYATGAYTLDLANDPLAAHDITAIYATDFEAAPDIPKVIMRLTSKSVDTQIYTLKDTIGLEQAYAMRKRFGMVAEDEVAQDLVAAINAEICNNAIAKLVASAQGNVNWAKATPAGISTFEHYQSFKYALAESEATMLGNAGRGTISVTVAGLTASSIIGTLPGFVKISDGTTIGPHIYGTLDGVTIIRVPNSNIMNPNKVINIYKGASPFEAALVYAPYMPLVVTSALPTGANPLTNQKAAAVWAGLNVLVPNFATSLTLT